MSKLRKADQWIENALIGAGYGLTNQLEGLYQMAAHPLDTLGGLGTLLSHPRQLPAVVQNALADTVARASSGPLGLGEVIGENLPLSPSSYYKRAMRNDLITYHGSPHRINNVDEANPVGKFDLAKVGTGEGAQAYGHGIYLAEVPDTAKEYMRAGRDLGFSNFDDPMRLADKAFGQARADKAKALQILDAEIAKTKTKSRLANLQIAKQVLNKGQQSTSLYTVDLPDEHIAKMLDWDAPLSEQPEAVRKALADVNPSGIHDGIEAVGGGKIRIVDDPDFGPKYFLEMGDKKFRLTQADAQRMVGEGQGQSLYRALMEQFGGGKPGERKASEYLRSLGIPGIKYLDQGSRTAGEGTRNFVIFDPDIAKILKRE